MSKDPKSQADDTQHEHGVVLRSAILLALPLLSLQRSVLDLVQEGIQKAVLIKPVQNLLLAEIQACMMILDPDHKWRNQLGVDFEKKAKELLDELTEKVASGSLQILQAQHVLADRLIELLKTLKDGQKRKRA